MNNFDKQIKDKVEGLKVNPSQSISDKIKASKPRQGFKEIISNNKYIISATAITAAIGILLLSGINREEQNKKETESEKIIVNNTKDTNKEKTVTEEKDKTQKETSNQDNKSSLHKIISTYTGKVKISLSEKGKWQNIPEYLVFNKNDKNLIIKSDNNRKTKLKYLTPNKEIIYHLNFLEKPEIFANADTIIRNDQITLNALSLNGSWNYPDKVKLNQNGKLFVFILPSEGRYKIKRTERDSIGSYTDSINIVYKPEKNDCEFFINEELCQGDSAILRIENCKKTDFNIKLSKGHVEKKSKQAYVFYFPNVHGKVNYIISDNKGKKYRDSEITIHKKPTPEIKTENSTCHNTGSIEVKTVPGIDNYKLDNYPVQTGKKINVSKGIHTIKYTDSSGCVYNYHIRINDTSLIRANFEFQASIDGMSVKTFNNSYISDKIDRTEITYQWYLNGKLVSEEYEPEIQLKAINNKLKLIITDNKGCKDTYKVNNIKSDEPIRIPTFFSPNNDGYFDVFKPIIDKRIKKFSAVISNRTGQVIYRWNDPEEGWNGKIHGNEDASPGVYFYNIIITDSTGKTIEKRGTVQLLRK